MGVFIMLVLFVFNYFPQGKKSQPTNPGEKN